MMEQNTLRNAGRIEQYWAVSHLRDYSLLTKIGALRIQAPHHRPKCTCLHCPIWKAIHYYPLRNCSLALIVGLRMGSIGASHEGSVASGFLLRCRWSWQLVDREVLAIGLRFRSKGVSSCNVLGSSNAVGLNVSCHASPQTIMVGNQGGADTTLIFNTHSPCLFDVSTQRGRLGVAGSPSNNVRTSDDRSHPHLL